MTALSMPDPGPVCHLYLIECADGSYYAGVATDVERRYEQHLNGTGARYTRSHKPVCLLAYRVVGTRSDALKTEHAVKRMPKEDKLATFASSSENQVRGVD